MPLDSLAGAETCSIGDDRHAENVPVLRVIASRVSLPVSGRVRVVSEQRARGSPIPASRHRLQNRQRAINAVIGSTIGPWIAHFSSNGYAVCAKASNAMKIRVIIRWSTVRPEDVRRTICSVSKQMLCRVAGHRADIEVKTGKLALKCARCGWESTGWTIDSCGYGRPV
jgi:hypothetical protein